MARTLKVETPENLTNRFNNLRAAVLDIAENEKFILSFTPETPVSARKDAIARLVAAQSKASEEATYLGSVFGRFLGSIAERRPEVMVEIGKQLSSEIVGIAEAINSEKSEVRDKQKEAADAKVNAKVNALLAAANAKLAKNQK